MSSVRNNAAFDNWRLSRIEEEDAAVERLSCSSSCSSSPRSAEGTLERRLLLRGTDDDASHGGIYSCTGMGGGGGGGGKEMEEEGNNKDAALRFIKEKYDSLGKVKVKKPPSGDVQPSDEGQGHGASSASFLCSSVESQKDGPSPVVVESAEATMRTRELQEHLHRSSSDVIRSTLISEQEVNQVEMFYRSHKTSVFVCPCQATLYLSDPKRNSLAPIAAAAQERRSQQQQPQHPLPPPSVGGGGGGGGWTVVRSGVPVLVLDSGETRLRQRRLHVVLAERGTGFCLWRDQIDCLTGYSASSSASSAFHTMQLSTDHSKTVGLRFDDPPSAALFVHQIHRLTSNADDPLLSLSSSSSAKDDRRKKGGKGKGKTKVTKADISQPCCFTHITKLDPSEGSNLLLRNEDSGGVQRNSPRPQTTAAGDRLKVKLKP